MNGVEVVMNGVVFWSACGGGIVLTFFLLCLNPFF